MGAGIAEVFARNGYDVIGVEVNDAGARARTPAPRALHRSRGDARQDDRGAAGRAPGPHRASPRRWPTLAEADLVVEAVVESLELKKSIFRPLDDIVRPDAVLATNTSSLQRHRDLHGLLPAGPGRRRALLQPRARAEPRRDRPHRRHRAGRAGRRPGPAPRASARTRSSAATRPASSPTPCSSATSTTPSRCTRASTPPARTSTPPCASAAATRWARWRCST